VASGKGGTGKTLVATNIFYSLYKNSFDVNLIDCDAEAPNAIPFFQTINQKEQEVFQDIPEVDINKCNFCNACHEWCMYNAIFILPQNKIIKIIDDLCHGCGACFVSCKNKALKRKEASLGFVSDYKIEENVFIVESKVNVGVMSPVKVIKAGIKHALNRSEILLFDCPPGTSCSFIQTNLVADFVILVTEPTPFGLSDLKQSIYTLQRMNKKYGVIINRSGLGDEVPLINFLKEKNIPLLMKIPYDSKIASAYARGLLFTKEMKEYQSLFISLINQIINNIEDLNKE
jgi:MinD superfamily P-loop ATPase